MAVPDTSATTASLQQQARALGEPSRHAIFRHVAGASHPVDVAELTDLTGLHHNAVRQHLAKLVEADLLVELPVHRGGPGRPRLCYEVRAPAESRWGVTGSYEQLALLLTEIIRTGDTPVEVGRRAGRRIGAGANLRAGTAGGDVRGDETRSADGAVTGRPDDGGDRPWGDPVDEMVAEMARAGFEPSVARGQGHVDVTLQSCAFASTAASDPATVCQLHLGIAHGVAESVGGIVIDELLVSDPSAGTCHLRCHLASDAPTASSTS
jgi:predicted ArsR family transcriptional regulator